MYMYMYMYMYVYVCIYVYTHTSLSLSLYIYIYIYIYIYLSYAVQNRSLYQHSLCLKGIPSRQTQTQFFGIEQYYTILYYTILLLSILLLSLLLLLLSLLWIIIIVFRHWARSTSSNPPPILRAFAQTRSRLQSRTYAFNNHNDNNHVNEPYNDNNNDDTTTTTTTTTNNNNIHMFLRTRSRNRGKQCSRRDKATHDSGML